MADTAILLFAFGANEEIRSNQVLLKEALRCSKVNGVGTIFSQKAILTETNYWDENGKYYRVELFDQPDPSKHPPTLRIARWAIFLAALDFRYERLIVIAADPHIDRCMRDSLYVLSQLRATHYANIKIEPWVNAGEYTDQDWFCADSTQLRTRTRVAWNKRESLLMKTPMWLYATMAG